MRRGSAGLAAAFLARAPRDLPSVTVAFDRSGGTPRIEIGHGAARWNDDGLAVAVCGGPNPRATARRLADGYRRDGAAFTPPRDTDGSWVLLDRQHCRALFGRDRTACQHLYVAERDGCLFVSTHLLPFISTVCKHLSTIGCDLFLASNTIAPFPLYAGVTAILPGHMHCVAGDEAGSSDFSWGSEYWRIQAVEAPRSYDRAVEEYGELFLEGMRPYVRAGEAGVLLSGGLDSACVVAGLCRLGVKRIVAVHMHVDGHQDAELALVTALRDRYGFELEVVHPARYEGHWPTFVDNSIKRHLAGSYETFPAYRLMAARLADRLPRDAPVFNGEMCLLDQGFSDASDRWRHLKRWLYRGAGRRLASVPPLAPAWFRRLAFRVGQNPSYWAAALEGILEMLHAVGRPPYYFAGMKVGLKGAPGAPRCLYRFAQGQGRDPAAEVVERFFDRVAGGLLSDDWQAAAATMANAWYSETSNFTMPLTALEEHGFHLAFAFSSPALMDLAASIPDDWARDKRIQKDMAARVLDMPDSVAYFQKDHSGATNYSNLMFSRAHQAAICEAVRATDYGPLQPGVDNRLRQIQRGERQYSVVMFKLYCLSIYQEMLRDAA